MFDLDVLRKLISNVIESPENPRFRSLNAAKVLERITQPNLAPWYILNHAGFHKAEDRIIYAEDTPMDHTRGVLSLLDEAAAHHASIVEEQRRIQAAKDQASAARTTELRAERLKREAEEKEAERVRKEAEAAEVARRKAEREARAAQEAAEREEQARAERESRIAKAMEGGKTREEAEEAEAQLAADEAMAKELAREMEAAPAEEAPAGGRSRARGAMTDDDDDEIDPALLRLAEEIKKGKGALAAPAASKKKNPYELSAEEKERVSLMTAAEKTEWLEARRVQIRAKIEAEEFEHEKQREIARVQQGKAALDLREKQEELEKVRMRDLYHLKKKEDAQKKQHRAMLNARLKEDQARRKREAEERAREVERIRREKAEQGQ